MQGLRSLTRAVGRLSTVTVAFAASVTALALSGATVRYTVWPEAKPDPRELLAASVDLQAIEPRVTLGEYLDRSDRTLPGADATDRAAKGALLYARVRIEGRKHEPISLSASYYDARTKVRLQDPSDSPISNLDIETPNDQWVELIFVSNPYAKPVFVRVALYDGTTMLAFADSEPIAATG